MILMSHFEMKFLFLWLHQEATRKQNKTHIRFWKEHRARSQDICFKSCSSCFFSGSPDGSDGNLPAMQETWIQSLGWEDPLEKGMAAHSSSLAWRIP